MNEELQKASEKEKEEKGKAPLVHGIHIPQLKYHKYMVEMLTLWTSSFWCIGGVRKRKEDGGRHQEKEKGKEQVKSEEQKQEQDEEKEKEEDESKRRARERAR